MSTDTYFVITDGTTTCTFADGSGGVTSYVIASESWTPNIASLRQSEMGGAGPYTDVVEEMDIHIYGSTTPIALANLATLNGLFVQADRFSRGENVAAVLVKYSPKGGTVSTAASPLQALVLGRVPGDEKAAITLSPQFEMVGVNKWLLRVRMRFVRRGLWLCSTQSASSAVTNNGDIATIDLTTALNALSPTKIALTNVFARSDLPSGFLALSDVADAITVVNAESMATGVLYTSVADGGNYARNTNILRYSPADTTLQRCSAVTFTTSGKRLAVFVNARISSGTTTFMAKARFGTSAVALYDETLIKPIAAGSAPKWFDLGIIALQYLPTYFDLTFQASAGSGAIDIDSVVIVDVSLNTTQVIALDWKAYTTNTTTTLTIDHRYLTDISPLVSDNSVALTAWGWRGDAHPQTRSRYLYALLMRTGGATSATRWRTEASAAVHQNTWTLTRSIGYLVPE